MSKVLADLENQVVSALNATAFQTMREGVALAAAAS
jgi:hypothetical protein